MKVEINVAKIEKRKEIKEASLVLKRLEEKGLKEPAIASGWIRGWLTGIAPSDIDIAYVGDVHFEEAQKYLQEILDSLNIDKTPWDIKGIWNAQLEYPEITTTERNYLLFYVDSIDSVYLASDGKLHDTTGYGFEDAKHKVLRMNDFTKMDFVYRDSKLVYLCLEGCRRVAKFGWTPTEQSIKLIKDGLSLWSKLSESTKKYFIEHKIIAKYQKEEFLKYQAVYNTFGWGFIFDEALKFLSE
jgi:hypothetical protein